MSEIDRIEQGFKNLFTKLLMAESDEDRKATLETLKKEPGAEKVIEILAGKFHDSQSSFREKAFELYYDGHVEEDFDEFKATLTLSANEIPGFWAKKTNITVTWSLLEKVNKAVSIAWMDEINRRLNESPYKSIIGLGFFEADPQTDHAPDAQGPSDPTDNYFASQNPQVSPATTTRLSKTLPNSGLNTPAPSQYDSFDKLFKDPDELVKCINALKAYRPQKPVINDHNTWMGKRSDGSKGILIAWVGRLMFCEKIPDLTAKDLAPLLEKHFPGLKFGKHLRHFENLMKADFSKLIPK